MNYSPLSLRGTAGAFQPSIVTHMCIAMRLQPHSQRRKSIVEGVIHHARHLVGVVGGRRPGGIDVALAVWLGASQSELIGHWRRHSCGTPTQPSGQTSGTTHTIRAERANRSRQKVAERAGNGSTRNELTRPHKSICVLKSGDVTLSEVWAMRPNPAWAATFLDITGG